MKLIQALFVLSLFSTSVFCGIHINHESVALFTSIPAQYRDSITHTILLTYGESHSTVFGLGPTTLETLYPEYPAATNVATLQYANNLTYSNEANHYNATRAWAGEDTWVNGPISAVFNEFSDHNADGVDFLIFGWCWDESWTNAAANTSAGIDPVYLCHWYGRTSGGPQGDRAWGIDSDDSTNCGNSVTISRYMQAYRAYSDTCRNRGYHMKVIMSTGPAEFSWASVPVATQKEMGYQRHLKFERIREYCDTCDSCILFDFNDILTHNNAGVQAKDTFTDTVGRVHIFPKFNSDNGVAPNASYHFGDTGGVRIAKALYVMMAIAYGWNPPGVRDTVTEYNNLFRMWQPRDTGNGDSSVLIEPRYTINSANVKVYVQRQPEGGGAWGTIDSIFNRRRFVGVPGYIYRFFGKTY
jgi:hypothetical protein